MKKLKLAPLKQKIVLLQQRLDAYMQKRPHRSFKRTRSPRKKIGGRRLPSVRNLLTDTWHFVWQEKRLFGVLGLIYTVGTFLIVGGISQVDLLGLKDATQETFADQPSAVGTSIALFIATMSGTIAASRTDLQQFLAVFLGFMLWLAVVWTARMRLANKAMKVRDALYNCGAPLIPSFLLLLVVLAQLLPAVVGVFLFTLAQSTGFLQNGVESMAFSLVAFLLCILSLYWLASTSLAMIIVTLPNMYPLRALATASELVIGQRWALALRLVVLFVAVFIVWVVILGSALFIDSWLKFDWLPLVPIVAQLLSAVTLVYGSAFAYKMYRSLL